MFNTMDQLKKKVSSGEKGFTLVELLIVVAIIGILAAIAIPQFAAYRLRSYNASGLSDMRNARTSQEALFADWQVYGYTVAAAIPGPGGFGLGNVVTGPGNPAAPNIITTTDNVGTFRGLQIATGNRVMVISVNQAVTGASFTVAAKHTLGDTVFAGDSDSTAAYGNTALATSPPSVLLAGGEAIAPLANQDEYALAGIAAGWTPK